MYALSYMVYSTGHILELSVFDLKALGECNGILHTNYFFFSCLLV